MGIFGKKRANSKGFTVVEIITVLTVIAILVSIVIVLYPGYQKRSRDNERKSDMQQIAASLGAYVLQKNDYVGVGSGCGLNGNGSGWFNVGPSENALYPKAIATCLQEVGTLKSGDFIDPLNCKSDSGGVCGTYQGTPAQGYMKATCTKSGAPITYIMTHLENDPRKDAEVDALCDVGSISGFDANGQKWGTNYGMNYYVVAK
jgi:prepilin-type N-terminal cleavage/methylation domain-containing protein